MSTPKDETPRVDAALAEYWASANPRRSFTQLIKVARQLERELRTKEAEALERAAKVCGDYVDEQYERMGYRDMPLEATGAVECMKRIRSLNPSDRQQMVCGWIPVDPSSDQTKPPYDGAPVLIATNHQFQGRVHRARWTDEIHGSGIFGWAVDDCKHGPYALRGYTVVTHWQPLPEPPAHLSAEQSTKT